MKENKILNSVLVKPVGADCNMNCSYCFYLEKGGLFRHEDRAMSDELLESLIRQVVAGRNRLIRFVWQGGEPVLAGIPFYRRVVRYQEQYRIPGQQVENLIQTNGVGVDREWADFFLRHRFYVGLSLDGPERIHNRHRRLKGGEPSWKDTVAARDLLMTRGVPVSVITVINSVSVRHPEEIYRFHRSAGIDTLRFVPVMDTGLVHEKKALIPDPGKYGEFLCRIFDLWVDEVKEGGSLPHIDYFDSLLRILAGEMPGSCTLLKTCGLYLTVEKDGRVYPCDFYANPEHCLGNMRDIPLAEMLNSGEQKKFGEEKKELNQACLSCPWLTLCRGGCPAERTGTGSLSRFCLSYRIFLEYAFPVLSGMIGTLPP